MQQLLTTYWWVEVQYSGGTKAKRNYHKQPMSFSKEKKLATVAVATSYSCLSWLPSVKFYC